MDHQGRRSRQATMTESPALDVVLRCLRAIEQGATGDALGRHYTDDVVHEELPNTFNPTGAVRDKAGILAAAARGQALLASQTFTVLFAVAEGDRLALELEWTGTLKLALGALPVGAVLRARGALIAEIRDGKIGAQRNYDCFEPAPGA